MHAPIKMGKEKTLPIIAIIILLIGIFSTMYVHASTVNKETIKIAGNEYTIEQIFLTVEIRNIETNEGRETGVALDDLILKTGGINCPSCHTYTFKAEDGYQQTVDWKNMENGILTDSSRVIFPDTAHALWVRDVIEIEVK